MLYSASRENLVLVDAQHAKIVLQANTKIKQVKLLVLPFHRASRVKQTRQSVAIMLKQERYTL
jgi:hypothetical protein